MIIARGNSMRPISGRNTMFFLGLLVVALGLCLAACGKDDSPLEPLPPVPPAELFGEVFYHADGSTAGIESLQDREIIGIYFATRTCPACVGFTPLLVNFFNQLRQAGKSFEIVFVSLDPSVGIMFSYMVDYSMPWLALPWAGDHAVDLTRRWDVRWVPTLIIIDRAGHTLSWDGRADINAKGVQAYDDWLARSKAK
jgi:nucleoredoxin